MSSYIYMKILESQPHRYDRGIALLSLGQADRFKRRIVEENVRAGTRMLEIGAGTGTMALMAVSAGALVYGFDVSGAMLDVAREKIEAAGLGEKVELVEMGVSGMDRLEGSSFDLVASTLVFSELSHDERAYALREAFRALKPGGRLVIADEARPRSAARRLVHSLVRIPLLVVTFALTQTSTRAVEGLEDQVKEAGFVLEIVERYSFDSFIFLTAGKEEK